MISGAIPVGWHGGGYDERGQSLGLPIQPVARCVCRVADQGRRGCFHPTSSHLVGHQASLTENGGPCYSLFNLLLRGVW
jgi:hypothetical protein